MRSADRLDLLDDPVLLLQACSAWLGDQVLARVRAEVGPSVRANDGYVFQHLVGGPCSITELAGRLGVTQQAASKQVVDLEARGLVGRLPDPDDGRAKLVALTARGERAVAAARAARRDLGAELEEVLGPRTAAATVRALRRLSERTGALEHLASRRLRPEADR